MDSPILPIIQRDIEKYSKMNDKNLLQHINRYLMYNENKFVTTYYLVKKLVAFIARLLLRDKADHSKSSEYDILFTNERLRDYFLAIQDALCKDDYLQLIMKRSIHLSDTEQIAQIDDVLLKHPKLAKYRWTEITIPTAIYIHCIGLDKLCTLFA